MIMMVTPTIHKNAAPPIRRQGESSGPNLYQKIAGKMKITVEPADGSARGEEKKTASHGMIVIQIS